MTDMTAEERANDFCERFHTTPVTSKNFRSVLACYIREAETVARWKALKDMACEIRKALQVAECNHLLPRLVNIEHELMDNPDEYTKT